MKKVLLLFIVFVALAGSNLSAQTVYITKTGEKYHTGSCRYLSSSKYSIELNEAIQKGYGPCSVCRPPIAAGTSSPQRTTIPSDNKRTVSVQCAGTTKSGSRCKRMTLSSNGYCWQHGGN
jgi:hypothetical protein